MLNKPVHGVSLPQPVQRKCSLLESNSDPQPGKAHQSRDHKNLVHISRGFAGLVCCGTRARPFTFALIPALNQMVVGLLAGLTLSGLLTLN